jgi:hypothetical protein
MTRWYRAYEGTVTDAKLAETALIAETSRSVVIATWHAILESCAITQGNGRFETTARRVAASLGEPTAVIERVFAGLTEVKMTEGDVVIAWSKRQFESDISTERSRKHRQASRNVNATLQQQHATPPETDTKTNTEAETKKEEPSLRSVALTVDVSRATSIWPANYRNHFWQEYPRKKAKKAAFKALDRVCKSGEVPFDRLMAAVRKIPTNEPVFIPHPATWLNGGRWDDEQSPGETVNAHEKTGSIIAAADRLVARLADFDRPPPGSGGASLRSGEGANVVRLLSER